MKKTCKECACGEILYEDDLYCEECGRLAPGLSMSDTEVNAIAHIEGWTISECAYFRGDDEDGPPYQLQKLDARKVFKADHEAWEHVVRLARAGSYVHKQALRFLEVEAPEEAAAIEEHCSNLAPWPYVREPKPRRRGCLKRST